MQYIFLTQKFYDDHAHCPEIEQKTSRPYAQVYVRVDGTPFAVPLRSNITHPHALMTDAENGCGLDYSKAVVIAKPEYIAEKKPKIRPNEYDFLRGRDFQVRNGLKKYIKEYKKARLNPHIKRYQTLCAFSTLQYFEKYIRDI